MWSIDLRLPPEALDACRRLLDPAERARADRFLRPEDRQRFVASHAALRLILGAARATDPRTLAFTADATGKPELARGPSEAPLHLNLSHSGPRALVGLSTRAPIGVDVEALRPMPDALRLARDLFAADEAQALARLPDAARDRAFLGLWTRKEAVVKALGLGLSAPLSAFSVTVPPDEAALLRPPAGPAAGWTLHDLEPGPGTVGTAALTAADEPIRRLTLPPDWTDALG
ncbi:4'-phosphopantetheinyl transferase family protein [Methylobacterium sp. A54F]